MRFARLIPSLLVVFLMLTPGIVRSQGSPELRASRDASGRIELRWSVPGFRLETASTLQPPVWNMATADGFTTQTNATGDRVAVDLRPEAGQRFFRLRSVESASVGPAFDIGTPDWVDLFVDPVHGDDNQDGRTRSTAFRGLLAAFRSLPEGNQVQATRIRLLPGTHTGAYLEDRLGTPEHPILIEPADGPGTVEFRSSANGDPGSLQFFHCAHVYLQDFRISVNGGDALHWEQCHHVLVRRMRVSTVRSEGQDETLKVNQCQYVYIEDSDISDAGDNCIDVVAGQWGHIVRCRIHNSTDWATYLKGGSAYWLVEGNEIWQCGTGGFTAGQGSGMQFMTPPWIHYECYDIKVVNNIIHDCEGAGLGVNGGFNILMAHNTLFRVGQRSHTVEFVHGSRGCDGGATNDCQPLLNLGAWGTAGEGGQFIPNRNVLFANNVIYNPPGYPRADQFLEIAGPSPVPADSNLTGETRADDGLVIRGNVFWNGIADYPIGISDDPSEGCHSDACTPELVAAGNRFNQVDPGLVNPDAGDFRPAAGSALVGLAVPLPDFDWTGAPQRPVVPAGTLSNAVLRDQRGASRIGNAVVGALLP